MIEIFTNDTVEVHRMTCLLVAEESEREGEEQDYTLSCCLFTRIT